MEKKEKLSVSWEILFKKQEIWLMRWVLLYTSFVPNEHWELASFYPSKEDELVAMNTFKEFKKAFKEGKDGRSLIEDHKLLFWTDQKALIIRRLNDFQLWVADIEVKYDIIEKLK